MGFLDWSSLKKIFIMIMVILMTSTCKPETPTEVPREMCTEEVQNIWWHVDKEDLKPIPGISDFCFRTRYEDQVWYYIEGEEWWHGPYEWICVGDNEFHIIDEGSAIFYQKKDGGPWWVDLTFRGFSFDEIKLRECPFEIP